MLGADQLYDRIGLALTSSANFFINYVVFQVRCCLLLLLPPMPLMYISDGTYQVLYMVLAKRFCATAAAF